MQTRNFLIAVGAVSLFSMTALAAKVPVISGGVGDDERLRIEAQQDQYNLKLVFTGERGMYLSDVHVVVRNAEDTVVIDKIARGPLLLAQLSPGKYVVNAKVSGFEKKLNVRAGQSLKTFHLNFPVKDEPANIPIYKNDSLQIMPEENYDNFSE